MFKHKHKREFLTGQWVYEKVLNIGTDQESANLNHNEIPLQTECPKFKKTDNCIRC